MVEVLEKALKIEPLRDGGARFITWVCVIALLWGGCATTQLLEEEAPAVAQEDQLFDDLAVFTETLLLVERNYVEEISWHDAVYKALDGMLHQLDRNSAFLAPKALEQLEEDNRGAFEGIGISVGVDPAGVKVIAPLDDSPAHRAGINAGDTITAIDGKSLEGISMQEAVSSMRGAKGSALNITVKREDGETVEMDLTRASIKVNSIKELSVDDNAIGYMRLAHFSEHAPEDFARAMQKVTRDGAQSLILDLRDNPGGLLDAAIAVAEQVLPKDTPIVTVRGRAQAEKEQQVYVAGICRERFVDLPMVLLVNGGSASASEVVAGALRDHKRAFLIGEKTFGKASVQSVVRLTTRPECAVRLTTGYYFTPAGQLIHEKGIMPDLEVPVAPFQWQQLRMQRLKADAKTNAAGALHDEQLESARAWILEQRTSEAKG